MFSTAFLDLPPLEEAAGTVVLPGSKSISNRVLLLAALSQGTTVIHDLLDSDDTRVMLDALRGLGCSVVHKGSTSIEVTGMPQPSPLPSPASGRGSVGVPGVTPSPLRGEGGGEGQQPSAKRLFLGNAGTAMRPLTAALALIGGDFEVSGVARMHERPIGDLVDA